MPGGWREEIVDLHAFFEEWLAGRVPSGADRFARVERALAPGFTFVSAHGRLLSRDELLDVLCGAHGSRPGLEIRIEEPTLRSVEGRIVLATYVEHQRTGEAETRRLSTAMLEAAPGDATGWRWRHVHETWIGDS